MAAARPSRITFRSITPTTVNQVSPMSTAAPLLEVAHLTRVFTRGGGLAGTDPGHHHPAGAGRLKRPAVAQGSALQALQVARHWGCRVAVATRSDAERQRALEMGADATDIGLTIHPHPTLSETVFFASEIAEGSITDLYMPKK